ncbi:VOC family protein [Kitasatospora sp. NPDC056138]|uniref:VOC family protein n=1 Tax=Kitasatospora sp. NPDC056138 TaxID=3345724 RepID=UPI0035D7BA6E
MRFHHVGVSVASLDRSLDWYEKVLGFQRGYSFEEPGAGLRGAFAVGPDGLSIELLERTGSTPGARGLDPFRAAGVHGYHHVCLAVEDLDATYGQVVAAGATEVWEPHRSPDPNIRVAYVADLDGNFIELLEQVG